MGAQAELDVAQALASSELGEGHAEELVKAGEALDVVLTSVPAHSRMKGIERQVIHELGKHKSTLMHGAAPRNGVARIERSTLKSSGG